MEDLKTQIKHWDTLDQLDRNIVLSAIMMQNQLSREGQEINKLAKEKGIV